MLRPDMTLEELVKMIGGEEPSQPPAAPEADEASETADQEEDNSGDMLEDAAENAAALEGLYPMDIPPIPGVHSLNLVKKYFRDFEDARQWVDRQGFSTDTVGEFDLSWCFFQKNYGGPITEKPIAAGVCLNVQLADGMYNEVPFAKIDDERRMVEGIVYEPWVPDAHGDWMHPDDIEAMAHNFLMKKRQDQQDVNHDERVVDGVVVVETFIAPKGHPFYPEGAWIAKSYIGDDDTWARIKRGELNGYSMAGRAKRFVGESPPQVPLFQKADPQVQDVEISKAAYGVKKLARLKNVDVALLSLVDRGANRRDWRIKKSMSGQDVEVFKSHDLRFIDGENQIVEDSVVVQIVKCIKQWFGYGDHTQVNGSGSLTNPSEERMEAMPEKRNGPLDLMVGMAYIAKRAATMEKALVALAKSPQFSPAVQASPELQGLVAEITKAGTEVDLQKFADGMVSFLEAQGPTVLPVPQPQNFSGFVESMFNNPVAFLSGFRGAVEVPGSYASGMASTLSKQEQSVAPAPAPAPVSQEVQADKACSGGGSDKMKDEEKSESDSMKKFFAEAMAAAMGPVVAQMAVLTKALAPQPQTQTQVQGLGGAPADVVHIIPAQGEDHPQGATSAMAFLSKQAPNVDEDGLDESIQKDIASGRVNSRNPFGSGKEAFGMNPVKVVRRQ